MVDRRRWHLRFLAMPLALLVLLFVGCAKQSGPMAGVSGDSADGGAAHGGAAGALARGDGSGGAGNGGLGANGGVGVYGDAAAGGRDGSTLSARRSGRGSAGGDGSGAGYEDSRAAAMMAAARPSPAEFSEAPALADIHFDFDRYDIRSDDTRALDANLAWLRANPKALILIEGHCDERGTNEYNLALGDHRAESAMSYLVAHGIPASRITVISYGEERPLCQERSEQCWAENRRSHFLVRSR
ncbi:MAG: peptidoglycan-associated lipoprotein Pal [Candidatus Rokubacteria bacterium]|nr:peptidoglycan-associated lipoprotein Pal [Candidatus Rokubacteria bacterium]